MVFEAGYFVGKLGKQNVVLSSDENIELLSDFQGVVYSNESE
ncbi:TIR domain-containing protein [Fusobacterium necrophorum]